MKHHIACLDDLGRSLDLESVRLRLLVIAKKLAFSHLDPKFGSMLRHVNHVACCPKDVEVLERYSSIRPEGQWSGMIG
jgi:hypothetical protein